LKSLLEQLLVAALPAQMMGATVVVERARNAAHGDYTSNVAMRLAKEAGKPPHELAQAIVAALPPNPLVAKAEVAGNGFINFFLDPKAMAREIRRVHELAGAYGMREAFPLRVDPKPLHDAQYAHARVASVKKELKARGISFDLAAGLDNLERLSADTERSLIATLLRFPEEVDAAVANCAPHSIVYYLREVANAFHTYYNAEKWLVEEVDLRNARLALVLAAGQVIRNGLTLIGVSAPESL
jgi:arginyl-tRNA synthetase